MNFLHFTIPNKGTSAIGDDIEKIDVPLSGAAIPQRLNPQAPTLPSVCNLSFMRSALTGSY